MQSFQSKLAWLLVIAPATGWSQATPRLFDHNLHGWYSYNGDHGIGEGPWGIHLEGHWRRHDLITKWQQLLLRPAVNYRVSPNASLSAGYVFLHTKPYGDFPRELAFPEHRSFQQAILRQRLKNVDFQHRYRIEQRFVGDVSRLANGSTEVDSWRYSNRFRYQLRGTIPLREPWSLHLGNELFVNFGGAGAANVFDQNRASAGIGYHLSKSVRVDVGYLNQLTQQRNGRIFEVNHTIHIAVVSTARFQWF